MEKFANVLNAPKWQRAAAKRRRGIAFGYRRIMCARQSGRLAAAIKQHVSIPVIAVCGISPEMGEKSPKASGPHIVW